MSKETAEQTPSAMVKSWLVDHLAEGAAIAAVLEGNEGQEKVRLACGATLPNRAALGTIRFDYTCDSPAAANEERRPFQPDPCVRPNREPRRKRRGFIQGGLGAVCRRRGQPDRVPQREAQAALAALAPVL